MIAIKTDYKENLIMSKEFLTKTKECLQKAIYTSPKIEDLYIRCKLANEDEFCEDDLFEFLSELCDEVETLYVMKQNTSSEEIENLKDKIWDLQDELSDAENDVDDLEDEIDSLKDDIDDLESKLSDAESRISELELKISSLEEENDRLKSNID